MTYTEISQSPEALESLINACMENEREAQNQLYRMFYPRLMPMVLRYYSDYSLAEEILHDCFLKVYKHIHTFKYKGSFEGWIKTILRRTITDYARYKLKHKKHIILDDEVRSKDFSIPADQMFYDDLIKLVQELPDATRIAFNLFAIEGVPHKEIAKMLGISEGTSKWHIHRAREILQEKIINLKLL